MTVSMALEFAKDRKGQEVLKCVRAKGRSGEVYYSYPQLLAIEAAEKLALLRALGNIDCSTSKRS